MSVGLGKVSGAIASRGSLLRAGLGLMGLTLLGAGCQNPNGQGLQDFGSITGRLLDDLTGSPVAVSPIYISVGSTVVSQVDNQGGFSIPKVPAGKQTLTISAIGYASLSVDISVVKDQTSDAGYIRLVSTVVR